MPAYADPTDLPDPAPDDADTWILLASAVIDDAVLTAHYRTTSNGLPADPGLRDLFRAATVAQIKHWQALDLDPTLGVPGVTGKRRATSKSIGSASVAYEAGSTSTEDRVAALTALAPAAVVILGPHVRGPVIVHG